MRLVVHTGKLGTNSTSLKHFTPKSKVIFIGTNKVVSSAGVFDDSAKTNKLISTVGSSLRRHREICATYDVVV